MISAKYMICKPEMVASDTVFLLVEEIMTSQGGILKNTTGQDRPIWQEFVFCVFCPFWSASIIMPGIGSMALHP